MLVDNFLHAASLTAYVAAGAFWGCFTAGLRLLGLKPLDGSALVSTLSLPFLAIYVFWLDPQIHKVPLTDTIGQGIFQGIAFQILAVMLYSRGIGRLGATFGVVSMAMMPGIGVLMEYVFFGRVPFAQELIAIAIVVGGVGLVASASMKHGQ